MTGGKTAYSREGAIWLQAVIGWGAVIVVLLAALALGANRPVSWTLLALAITGLFCAQLIRDLIAPMQDRDRMLLGVVVLWLAVIGWAIAQVSPLMPPGWAHPAWQSVADLGAVGVISADPGQGRHGIVRLLTYGMVFWISVRAMADPLRAHNMLRVIALSSAGLAIFGLMARANGANPILGIDGQASVVSASFVNRNAYAIYAAFGCLANIACFLLGSAPVRAHETALQRLRNFLEGFFAGSWVYGLGAVICLVAVALTLSRAGAFACVIGLVTFVLAYRVQGRSNTIALVAMVVFIGGFVLLTSSTGLTQRVLTTTDEGGRFAVYAHVITGIQDRLLLGHGLGAFHDSFRAYLPLDAARAEWHLAHSSFLENAYELGLPTAAVFYLALLIIVARVWHGVRHRRRDRVFPCLVLAVISAATVHAMFDFSLQMPATAALFAMFLGLGWAQGKSHRDR